MSGSAKNELLVTREKVWESAAGLVAGGQKPTIDSIRALLGGGSPNTVSTHLRSWRAAQAEAARAASAPSGAAEEAYTVQIDDAPELQAALDSLTTAVLATCGRLQAAERRVAEEHVSSLAKVHTEALDARDREYASTLAALETLLTDTRADLDGVLPAVIEAEALRERVAGLETDTAGLRSQLLEREAETKALKAALSSAEVATKQASAESEAWREELRQSREETATVRRVLDGVQVEMAAARAAVAGAEAEVRTVTASLNRERAEVSALRRALEIAQAENGFAAVLEKALTANATLLSASSVDSQSEKRGRMADNSVALRANDERTMQADGQASAAAAATPLRKGHR